MANRLQMFHKIVRMIRSPRYSMQRLLHRFIFWGAAVVVGLAAIVFASSSSAGTHLFARVIAAQPLLAFVITPVSFAAVVWLTRKVFSGAEGSGIPQTIAALKIPELSERRNILSLRVAFGKILMTSLALCGGASVGREGPTVQVGAAIMHSLGRWIRLPSRDIERALVLAGGAAGIAAAFNTPLAGIVFAIEELSKSFEERTSGTVLTAVIIAGLTSLGILGNYNYFGKSDVILSLAASWVPVLLCGVVGGLMGGIFARLLITFSKGIPGKAGVFIKTWPVLFAFLCGLGLATLGYFSGSCVYGTGYEEARGLLEGTSSLPFSFGLMKLGATLLSYLSGIPGGIFAPSLSIGAGIGATLSSLIPGTPLGAFVILGMVGYFTGVVQAPITAVVIVIEMTSDQGLTLPLMSVALIAFVVSRLVCPEPLYRALAQCFLEKSVRRAPRPAPDSSPTS